MLYRLAADAVVIFHLLFIVFVLLGGLLVLYRPVLAAIHLPAMTWGAAVEFLHLYCPLTPLENSLRAQAGEQGYAGGFIEHYVVALIYPAGLTPQIQLWLGGVVVLVNVLVYGALLIRFIRRRRPG
jgi:hypothetical protein